MKWYGIISFLFIFFALAGIVYVGANTDKIGINFGEPSAISKQVPTIQSTADVTVEPITPPQSDTNNICLNADGYCMAQYGMSGFYGQDAYNTCVQNIMYQCNPELKNTQWSKNTCDRLEQELTEIRIMKKLEYNQNSYPGSYNDLMTKEYNLSQDILYHCD